MAKIFEDNFIEDIYKSDHSLLNHNNVVLFL